MNDPMWLKLDYIVASNRLDYSYARAFPGRVPVYTLAWSKTNQTTGFKYIVVGAHDQSTGALNPTNVVVDVQAIMQGGN